MRIVPTLLLSLCLVAGFLSRISSAMTLEGCPQALVKAATRLSGHVSAPVDWNEVLDAHPSDLAPLIAAYEWMESAPAEWFDLVGRNLGRSIVGQDSVHALSQICPSELPQLIAIAVSRLDAPKAAAPFSIPSFVSSLKSERTKELLAYEAMHKMLGEALLRAAVRFAGARKGRAAHTSDAAYLKSQTAMVDVRAQPPFRQFWELLAHTFLRELGEGPRDAKSFDDDWSFFIRRHGLAMFAYPELANLVREFGRRASAERYSSEVEGVPGEVVRGKILAEIDARFRYLYQLEAKRQARMAKNTVSAPPAVPSPLAPLVPPKAVPASNGGISRRRKKQQPAYDAEGTLPLSSFVPEVPLAFELPDEVPVERFVSSDDRERFLAWLNVEARHVMPQILRRLALMEAMDTPALVHTTKVIPTFRNPKVWRVHTSSKARIVVHYRSAGVYWILGWDEQAKASDSRMNKMIDDAEAKLHLIPE